MKVIGSRYYLNLAAFLLFLALPLLSLVDVRRGFLFSSYFKVGTPSVVLNLNLLHIPLLVIGLLGAWLVYKQLRRLEADSDKAAVNLQTPAKILAAVIGLLFVVDLFVYRGVPAFRTVASGNMAVGPGTLGLGWAIPVGTLPYWLQPLGEGVSYMFLVWHATLLSMLLGGLFLVAGAGLATKMKDDGFRSHLVGAALALTQPFCSCCAAPVGAALCRKGAAPGPVLAFTVSSPMLNITSLILATALLPAQFALLRILAGIAVGVLVTYAVSILVGNKANECQTNSGNPGGWAGRLTGAFNRLFNLEGLLPEAALSPVALVSNWLPTAWRLAKVMVPVLFAGAILASYIVRFTPDAGNTILGVVITSVFATLLMAPTWTEIPLAARFAGDGLNGLAAVVLITLPAVSLPCLVIVGGAVRSLKTVLILGLSVIAAGILAGIAFL